MRRLEEVLGRLPLDDGARRVIEEVFADWRHERAASTSFVRRAAVSVRAVHALTWALVLISWRDVRQVAGHALLRSTAVWLAAFSTIAWVVLTVRPPGYAHLVPPGLWDDIKPGWMVWWAGWFVPLAFFAAVLFGNAHRGAKVPVIGFAIVACFVTVLVDGWLVPWANVRAPTFVRQGALTFHELISVAQPTLFDALLHPGWSPLKGLAQLNETLARGATAVALVLLATAVGRRGVGLRIVIGVIVAAWAYSVGYRVNEGFSGRDGSFESQLARAWLTPAAAIFTAFVARSRRFAMIR